MSPPDVPTFVTYPDYLVWLDQSLAESHASQSSGTAHHSVKGASAATPQGLAAETATQPPSVWHALPGAQTGTVHQPEPWAPPLVVLPTGRCWVGAHPNDPDAQSHEKPRREIHVERPFAIGIAPVTFEQWDACLSDGGTLHRPSDATWGRGQRPVMNVSWHDAQEYLGWLSRKSGQRFRLPSEAEWIYAFWGGAQPQARYPWGDDLGFRQLRHHAWFTQNASDRTHPVGELHANPWGLVDMLGNVAEWVEDCYHRDMGVLPANGSAHLVQGHHSSRVFKGGSWLDGPAQTRPSARDNFNPDHRSYRVGFRVVMDLD